MSWSSKPQERRGEARDAPLFMTESRVGGQWRWWTWVAEKWKFLRFFWGDWFPQSTRTAGQFDYNRVLFSQENGSEATYGTFY